MVLTISTIPTIAQTTTTILTTVNSHLNGWKTISHKGATQTQHHKGWKTCRTLMTAWLSITNQVWTHIPKHNRAPGAMAADSGGAQSWATEHKTTQWFFLHDLKGKWVPFYSLSVEETIHGGLVAAARSSRSLTVSHDLTRASPAPRSSPKASPWSPQASPRFNCLEQRWIQLMRWLSLCARVRGLWDKIWWARAAIYRAF
jgi:hypothetical protein